MVAFNKDDYQRLDLQILKNGAISLFFDQHILDEACAWFRQQAYQIDIFDASIWQSAYDFYDDIHSKLGLVGPPESGLDALNDNLVELDIPYESGRLLVFQHFERFARKDKQFAWHVLDILQHTSRKCSLYGYRLIAFVQVDDPQMTFERVGALSVWLNPIEQARRFGEQIRRAQERLVKRHGKRRFPKDKD